MAATLPKVWIMSFNPLDYGKRARDDGKNLDENKELTWPVHFVASSLLDLSKKELESLSCIICSEFYKNPVILQNATAIPMSDSSIDGNKSAGKIFVNISFARSAL